MKGTPHRNRFRPRYENENAPVQYPMNRGAPNSASCTVPSAVGAVGESYKRFSTTSVAGTTVVTEIAISIANRDCTAITATWSVRLELGELLISSRR